MVLALIFSIVLPWVPFVGCVIVANRLGLHEVSLVLAVMAMLLLYIQNVVHPICRHVTNRTSGLRTSGRRRVSITTSLNLIKNTQLHSGV